MLTDGNLLIFKDSKSGAVITVRIQSDMEPDAIGLIEDSLMSYLEKYPDDHPWVAIMNVLRAEDLDFVFLEPVKIIEM